MRYVYTIMMFAVAGGLLLYALLASTGDSTLLPRSTSMATKVTKEYMRKFAKTIALIALAPLNGAVVGLIVDPAEWVWLCILVPVVVLVAAIIIAVHLWRGEK